MEMEKDSIKVSFQEYIDSSFPVGGKRTRSAVIRKEVAQRIVNHLKGTPDADGAFRHFVKKSGFALVDLQSVGIRDVLVVSVKEKNQSAKEVTSALEKWVFPFIGLPSIIQSDNGREFVNKLIEEVVASWIPNQDTKKLIADIMQSPCPKIEVQYIDVQKQKGQSDCGLFAIAFATSLAHLQDPASITYDQAKMRTHLIHCFETQSRTPFPSHGSRRPSDPNIGAYSCLPND
eukprot:Em0016g644a